MLSFMLSAPLLAAELAQYRCIQTQAKFNGTDDMLAYHIWSCLEMRFVNKVPLLRVRLSFSLENTLCN